MVAMSHICPFKLWGRKRKRLNRMRNLSTVGKKDKADWDLFRAINSKRVVICT